MAAHQAIAETETEDQFVDELKPGTELMHGQYTIVSFLNSGGFGITYLAKDSLDRIVVIKECFPGNVCRRKGASVQPRSRAHQTELKSIVDLFTREAQNLAKADHPNIVGVHNVFEYNNTAYMALDYVKGRDLLDTITEEPGSLTPDRIVKYLGNLLNAIGFIHGKGILHRDISPDNIIINQHDEPVLIDFGAAREQATKQSRVLSQLRVVKDGYSPQEFYISGSEQNEASDLYSLAASFYHIITGDLPPDSQKRITAFASEEPDPYVPLAERTTDFSPAFCAALDKAMAVLPRDRVASAEEWLSILEGSRPVPTVVSRSVKPVEAAPVAESQKSKVPMLLGSTAIVAVIGVGMYFALSSGQDAAEVGTTAEVVIEAPTFAPVINPGEMAVAEDAEVFAPGVLTTPPAIQAEPSATELPVTTAFGDPEIAVPEVVATLPASPEANETANALPTPAPASPPEAVEAPAVTEDVAPEVAALPDVPTPTIAPDAAALEPVTVSSAPRLPFTLSREETGVITFADPGARFWMIEGVQISTINGQPLQDNDDILAALAAAPVDLRGNVSVPIGTKQPGSNIEIKRTLTVPVTSSIILSNGLTFESRPFEGGWATFVTGAPNGSQLEVGDRIVGFAETSEVVDGQLTFAEITRRELAEGRTNFSFALERNGEVWLESFSLAPLSN